MTYKIRITLRSETRESLDCYSLNEEDKKKKGRKGMVGYQLGNTPWECYIIQDKIQFTRKDCGMSLTRREKFMKVKKGEEETS